MRRFGREPEDARRTAPRHPSLYEINTRVWLNGLSRRAGRAVTLADVDDRTLDDLARRGFNWIWLLSAWRTSAASRAASRNNAAWRAEYQAVLPDLSDDDIQGSGFAIGAYEIDAELGGRQAMSDFRSRLAARGLRLMLDFVPNHTGLDHLWVEAHPDFYIHGSEQALAEAPGNYCQVKTGRGTLILAHGRDPNFPGWPDTLQLNYANPALQQAEIEELLAIAGQCDGVRCDMAMLVLPHVFQRTWGLTPGPFWPGALQAVRRVYPSFVFLAEVYWDLERELLQQGFDYCYDKRLRDYLRDGDVNAVRAHLAANADDQNRLARFLENHDEPRVAEIFSLKRHQAAAVITYLAPGLRFFHQGQLAGNRVRVPTQLGRGPDEKENPDIVAFYAKLLSEIGETAAFRSGAWSLLSPAPAWPSNPTWQDVIAYGWLGEGDRTYVIAANYSPHQSQCRLQLPYPDLARRRLQLVDVMGSERYVRDGSELVTAGLYLDLSAWQYNVFRLDPAGAISGGPHVEG